MEKMNQALEKMKMIVGMEVDEEQQEEESSSSFAFMDDFNRNCTLSTKQRFYGFAICFVAGLTCTLLILPLLIFLFIFLLITSFASGWVIFTVPKALVFCRHVWSLYHFLFASLNFTAGLASLGQPFSMLVFFNPIKFGMTFTMGNLLSFGSTAFLIGPKRQVTMMLDPVRIYATALYLASMIIALFCALYVHNKLLTLLAIILEFGALIWYSLSYIPFARSMVSKVMVACFDTEF